jgi:hypothetical protein
MSVLIILRSRIWFCSINVIGHYFTFLMFYIFTLMCHQWIAFVLECYFTTMEGFGFVDMLCLTVLLQFIVPYNVIYVSVLSLI